MSSGISVTVRYTNWSGCVVLRSTFLLQCNTIFHLLMMHVVKKLWYVRSYMFIYMFTYVLKILQRYNSNMHIFHILRALYIRRYFKIGKNWRLSWSGLWVLIMLLSTDVLNTSVSILNCPSLSDSNGNKNMVCTYLHTYVSVYICMCIYNYKWFNVWKIQKSLWMYFWIVLEPEITTMFFQNQI